MRRTTFLTGTLFLLLVFSLCSGAWLLLEFLRQAQIESLRRNTEVTAPETGFPFPALSDVHRMTATLDPHDPGGPVLEFHIPEHCWGEIIQALSPSQHDPYPPPWVVLGSLIIHLKDGETCKLDLFDVRPDPGLPDLPWIGGFSAESESRPRRCYRGGYTHKLKTALVRAHSEYEQSQARLQGVCPK